MARNKLCPQCDIRRFSVKNDAGEIRVVTVSENGVIELVHPEESLEGFDLGTLHCLGCSWKGSVRSLR